MKPEDLFKQQDLFVKRGIAIRWIAVDDYVNKVPNGEGFKLKHKWILATQGIARGLKTKVYNDTKRNKAVIDSFINEEEVQKSITVNDKGRLLDGSWRLTCCLYFWRDDVPVVVADTDEQRDGKGEKFIMWDNPNDAYTAFTKQELALIDEKIAFIEQLEDIE